MKVLKFGGTSVGTAPSIRNVKKIVTSQDGKKILVLSAMSGVTNELVAITEMIKSENYLGIDETIAQIKEKHLDLIDDLMPGAEINEATKAHIQRLLGKLKETSEKKFSESVYSETVTYGETMLTYIFSQYLTYSGIDNTWLNARDFMHISNLENPDIKLVGDLLHENLEKNQKSNIYITQGFVRIDKNNNIGTLKRGGSDYTATIIGAAIEVEEIQIWTDIDGFHNNDPRIVENTHPISHLSFEEAAELAYFGAKILHPQTVSPIINKNIPVYLKNTFTPDATGTKISSEVKHTGLKAISAKDDITAIKIKSNRMLMAHGFLRKIFEVFDKYETSIDMITTSEIAISLTIDDNRNLDQILEEIEDYGEITVEKNHSIICIVGEKVIEDKTSYRLFEILNNIQVRMISYGGSNNNISLLVDTRNKKETLRSLNQKLFDSRPEAKIGQYSAG